MLTNQFASFSNYNLHLKLWWKNNVNRFITITHYFSRDLILQKVNKNHVDVQKSKSSADFLSFSMRQSQINPLCC